MSGVTETGTVPLLPWPAEWGRPRPRPALIFVLIFFAVVSLGFIPFTVDSAASGDGLRAMYGAVGILVGLTFVAIVLPHMRVRRKRLPTSLSAEGSANRPTGFRLPLVRYQRAIMATWLVAGVVFLSIRGIIVITRLADRDEDLTSSATADVVQLVAIGFFLVLFIFLLGYFLMRPRANYLQLDADSVTQVIGGVTKTIQWDEIDTVAPWTVNDLSTVRIVPAPGVEIQVDTGKSLIDGWQRPRMQREIDLHAAAYGVDPALLLHLVRFYRNHADTRHELLSSTVLDRIRRGDLTA